MIRAIQKVANPVGLAIGWLIGSAVDAKLRAALPGWSIVATDERDLTVTTADLQIMRNAVGAGQHVPVLLFAWSAGCQSVRSVLLSGVLKNTPLAGVAVFDGTAGSLPPAPWQISVWKDIMDLARKGGDAPVFIGTCTEMGYVEHLTTDPYSSTRHILEAAADVSLVPGTPVVDGNIYLECFASKDIDAEAHEHQVNVVMPDLLKRLFSEEKIDVVEEIVPDWKNPNLPFGFRCIAWSVNEMQNGVCEIPNGSNDSPRIREYFLIPPFMRDGKQIHVSKAPWCAAAACMAHEECFLPDIDLHPPQARVAGLELKVDAEANGKFYTGEPEIGDLAIFTRDGGSHVARVVNRDESRKTFSTIAGNVNNRWEVVHGIPWENNETLLGFVEVQ